MNKLQIKFADDCIELKQKIKTAHNKNDMSIVVSVRSTKFAKFQANLKTKNMRTFKSIAIITSMLIVLNSSGICANYDVKPGLTTSITCDVGDTISFYSIGRGAHGVWINNFTTLAYGDGFSNASNELLTKYKVQANDSNFIITFQPDPMLAWSGTIHALPATNIKTSVKENYKLNIYPNPVTTQLKIESSVGFNLVYIKDIQNKVVYAIDNKNENFLSISVENLPNGIYFLEVNSRKKKFIKVK